ncbi:HipA domain-containing protein [Catenovulum sp. 2E275]|uniref:HipA domain-containing protein n=1 Tax=Catenovulum sp. 2E275 TaxID=2980497 RepID=UPI0021CE6B9C|nr:HipA domain-containing protein [Catenovulum sp. 2E275]MCU4677513.1 HipA domain-containing protein [Catenovulum sp. 2E275]
MLICNGTLKPVQANQFEGRYSKTHLKKMFALNAMPINDLMIKGTAEEIEHLAPQYVKGNSVSGVQTKLLMSLENGRLVPKQTGAQYIVKPAPKNFKHLPENELAIMRLAQAVGFNVAECSLVPFENGELGYVVKRFDIRPQGDRFLIEDAASLCNIHPKNKGSDELSYEWTLKKLFIASGHNKAVLLNGFRQVLFAYLVGNNDLHLKNFSLYREPGCRSTIMQNFTPLYDILSVAPYPNYATEYLSLSLLESETQGDFSKAYDNFGYYTSEDFALLAENIGLGFKQGQIFSQKLVDTVENKFKDILNRSLMPENIANAVQQRIEFGIRAMRL